MQASGTPFWEPATAALIGAVVGGLLAAGTALVAGWLADRRTRRNARIDRIRERGADIAGLLFVLRAIYWRDEMGRVHEREELRANSVQMNDMVARAGVATAEMGWLTAGTSLDADVQETLAAFQDLVNDGAHGELGANRLQRLKAAAGVLNDAMVRFTRMSYEDANHFLKPAPHS